MFTVEQINEIARKLQAQSKKDSQFPLAKALSGTEYVAILQDQENRKVLLSELTEYIKQQIAPDILAALELLKETLLEELKKSEKILYDKIEDAELHLAEKMDNNVIHFNDRLDELESIINKQTNEDVELSVVSVTPGSVIYLNGERRSKIKVKAADLVVIRVVAEGYQSFNEITCVHKSQHIEIELDKIGGGSVVPPGPVDEVTLTINPTPSNATVTLNGQDTRSITVEYGTTVTVVVSAAGYKTYTQNIVMTSDRTLEVTLQEETPVPVMHTLTVNATPSDATVKLNNQVRNSITVEQGTTVSISVSKTGYRTHTESVTVDKDMVKDITLTALKTCVLTVTATPSDAVIEINGSVTSTYTGYEGEEVTVYVSAFGYRSESRTVTLSEETQTLHINLEELEGFLFKITVISPAEAILKVNGTQRTSPYELVCTDGDYITWEVSAEGYITQSNRFYIHENVELEITLEPELSKEQVTFTVSPTPDDCTVRLNGVTRKSITVDKGSVVTWEVSKNGYITKSGSEVVQNSITFKVSLDAIGSDESNFTINVLKPLGAVVTINGKVTNSVTVRNGTEVNWSVVAPHYESQSGTQTVTEDTVKDITLVAEQVTLTVAVATMPMAPSLKPTVELNGVVRDSITVDYNTKVHIKVSSAISKTYEEDYTVTETETKNIEVVSEIVWDNLTITQADSSPNPITNVPFKGGDIALKAMVSVRYSDNSTEVRDVTSDSTGTIWTIVEGQGNGITFKGNGVFTWPENTSIDQRTATIRCGAQNLAAPSTLNANSNISTIQQGKQSERLEVVPDSLEFNAEGGTQTLQITSNTSWSIQ